MPAALPFVAAALAPAGGFAIGSVTISYAALAAAGTSLAVGAYQADQARKKARDARNSSFQDRQITVRSAVAARKYVLGTVRVGGALMYADTVGPNKSYFDQVIALGSVQAESWTGVYLNEDWLPVTDFVSERPTTGRYSTSKVLGTKETKVLSVGATSFTVDHTPRDLASIAITFGDSETGFGYIAATSFSGTTVNIPASAGGTHYVTYDYEGGQAPLRVQVALGSPTQTATSWSGVSTPKWTTDHRLQGVTNIRTLMEWSELAYGSGGAPAVEPVVRGPVTVYDPRITATVSYTSNPALLARWYMLLPRIEGGCGIPSAWIDDAAIITAANICDELISVKQFDGTGYDSVKRYECHTLLTTEAAPLDNLDLILASMAGGRAFTAGKYRIFAGAFRTATFTITDADVYTGDAIEFGSYAARTVPPNMATGTFRDAQKAYVETGAKAVVNSTYVTADGGVEEPLDVTLGATTDERLANYLMGVALERARGGFEISLTVLGKGADISLMQSGQIDLTHYSAFAGMTFEVVRYRNGFNGRYRLTLRQTKSTTYALDADRYTPVAQPAAPDLSYIWSVDDVDSLAVSIDPTTKQVDGTGASNVTMSWTLHTQDYVKQSGRIEMRYRAIDQTAWVGVAPAEGSDTSASFTGSYIDGMRYEFQARAVNGFGAFSKWVRVFVDASSTTPTYSGGNLLSNSSCEVDTDGDGLADNWVAYSSGTTGTIVDSITTAHRHGNYAQAKTIGALASGALAGWYQAVTGNFAGRPMVSAVDLMATIGTLRLQMDFFTSAAVYISSATTTMPAETNVWRHLTLPFTAPALAQSARFYAWVQGGDGSTPIVLNMDCAKLAFGEVETLFATREDEILPDAVDTEQLAAEAAAKPYKVEVNTDTTTLVLGGGTNIANEFYTPITVSNPTSRNWTLEVSATGWRKLTAPSGMVAGSLGGARFLGYVAASNVTDSVAVPSPQDYFSGQIERLAAGQSAIVQEATVFNCTLPPGKTFEFTPLSQIMVDAVNNSGGGSGTLTLETRAYTLRVTVLKR
jgi:hypothetical protein